MNTVWNRMIDILKTDVVPATGCTEPVSLAYASAVAARELGEPVQSIEARVSPNLMKNGMGVMVPGTGRPGLLIAAAVGALGGDPDAGLQVLESASAEAVQQGAHMVDTGLVTVGIAEEIPYVLYSEALVKGEHHAVKVCIANGHTNVISIEKDGESIFSAAQTDSGNKDDKIFFLQGLGLADILEFAEQVPLEQIEFLRQSEVVNDALSKEGLTGNYGLHLGCSMKRQQERGLLGNDLLSKVVIRTVGASDARMGGAKLPAMTNSGSGNQGISATMPVVAVADYVQASPEARLRALALSHMTAIYAHAFLPKLSAFCATITACMGAAAGMAWLMAKEDKLAVIRRAICSMTGDISGMVCDGAANSCSMKVASACTSAVRAVILALDGVYVSGHDGLVAFDADECIHNLGQLASHGMQITDQEILRIMMNKNKSGH